MGYDSIAVLVVEDEVLVRIDVALASDADEAIHILNTHPDIRSMFTEIDMPGSMDGLKLAAAVRDRRPPIKIIITSGHRRLSDELLPVDGKFFAKPYDTSIVIDTMRSMMASR